MRRRARIAMGSVTIPSSSYTPPPEVREEAMLLIRANLFSLPPTVIERICEILHEEKTRWGMQALASFSRTCWAINVLAQGVLWRTLPSIAPLLRTLPADLCLFRSQVIAMDGSIVPSSIVSPPL
ncbi:hypothetical protein NUW54_g2026 [Trametes sanguinea]|uniref:Uncharacterized protein n=1 Tax=Trametes sanguinea TaxID=158606 RepID=A0ACC1Q6D0_9APHY|nr:hypothetical protein NUW54_g2026 [Trametes sanguinea]